MDNLEHLATWADPLLEKLSPQQRRKLLKQLVTQLRRNNQKRIAAQREPDGSRFIPRKGKGKKKGTDKAGALFPKLRKSRFIKVRATPDKGVIFFSQRAARIAAMHHYGLSETENGKQIRNTARPLLGISNDDIQIISTTFEQLASERNNYRATN